MRILYEKIKKYNPKNYGDICEIDVNNLKNNAITCNYVENWNKYINYEIYIKMALQSKKLSKNEINKAPKYILIPIEK